MQKLAWSAFEQGIRKLVNFCRANEQIKLVKENFVVFAGLKCPNALKHQYTIGKGLTYSTLIPNPNYNPINQPTNHIVFNKRHACWDSQRLQP